jgi:hypothetical protein
MFKQTTDEVAKELIKCNLKCLKGKIYAGTSYKGPLKENDGKKVEKLTLLFAPRKKNKFEKEVLPEFEFFQNQSLVTISDPIMQQNLYVVTVMEKGETEDDSHSLKFRFDVSGIHKEFKIRDVLRYCKKERTLWLIIEWTEGPRK